MDLIWAGKSMIAEVAGAETAASVYRLLDHEGSLVATRPSDLGGLGTSPIGIPNQNLSTGQILGESRSAVPNP